MTQNTHIQQQLDLKRKAVTAARKHLEKAQKNLENLEAELRGFEDAARLISGAGAMPIHNVVLGVSESGRGLTGPWKAVIREIAISHPKDFTLGEIAALAEKNGIAVNKDTLRGQMHHYSTQRRYLERTAPGQFRATTDGAAAAGVELGDDPEIPF